MEKQAIKHRAWGRLLFRVILLGFSALATLKVIFFFTEIDEQYAITMAYRMACGDRMFLEMWEPHQTSGFLAAFLIKIYMLVTGGVDGVTVYLRLAGVLFQTAVSLFLYATLKRFCSEDAAFATAFFYYNTLGKYSQTPDYANMLMWFGMLMLLCLLHFFGEERGRKIWLVSAGVSTSLMVLSYPTCILVVLPVCFGIWHMSAGRDKTVNIGCFLGTCGVCGLTWLLYFLSHMTPAELMYGVAQMMTDESHSSTLALKLMGYKADFLTVFPYAVAAFTFALVLWAILKLFFKKSYSFLSVLLFSAMAQQMVLWLTMSHHIKFPGIFYLILLVVGIYRYFGREKYEIPADNRFYQALFWFGSMTALWILFAALMASNMRLFESNEYMMVGMIAAFVYLERERKQTKLWWIVIVLGLFCVACFRKGYLMYYAYGKDTIFVTKQKALDGPLEGVYCRYMDGYDYNMRGIVIDQYIPRGSKVMYIGVETLIYLQGEYEVCNFSTISTPYLDERMFIYWERYPEKYPEYVIWDFKVPYESRPSDEVRERLLQEAELLAEDEGIQIYKMRKGNGTD